MAGERPLVTDEENEALAVLARHGRILAILVPEGIPDEVVKELSRQVNRMLDELVREQRAHVQ